MATSAQPVGQAPPNFYDAAAKMSGGGQTAAKASPDDKQEFLKDITKLLTILDKMGKRKPNGVDISKYMKAASSAVEDALKATSGSGDDTQAPAADATGDAQASAGAPPSPDTGSSGGAA